MKKIFNLFATALALNAVVAWNGISRADVVITTFDDAYFEDALYASWASGTIEYGPDSYSVTATGYGSNWTYIGGYGIDGTGNTHVKLDVTLEGPPAAEAHLGPIITLVDADGTRNNYAWFGQLLGNNILTLPVASPSWVEAAGTTPGLDLAAIDHMHLQIDPGGYGQQGPYTVHWNELSLVTLNTTPGDFDEDGDVDGRDFLAWQRDSSVGLLSDWQAAYGAPLAGFSSVPEPGTFGMMILASISAAGLRRFRGLSA